MEVGLYLRDYMENPNRPIHEQIEEAAEICRFVRDLGFSAMYMPQHYVSYPTVWPQPMQILSRMAPETGEMRLMTGILLLPYHNPVDLAEQIATVDHISQGRFTLGAGIGYREAELAAFGTNRRDRVSRFEESLALMQQLWTGETVNFEGKHWQLRDGKMGFTPIQKPHPPVWIAAQSDGAARRAAALGDACLIGPQPSWEDFRYLAGKYREFVAAAGRGPGLLAANRSMAIARDRETAVSEARAAGEAKAGMYANFNMQERSTVDLGLGGSRDLTDWAIAGSPQECVELIARCHEEDGLDFVGLACLNLPKEQSARFEYLQMIAEEFVARLP
ncbi:MAG: LLM class flavin-dependent oxidoreductase [Dehalococcoidia bacterium]